MEVSEVRDVLDTAEAAALQPPERERAAASITTTLPGLRLLHQGQLEGKRTRIPVFLRRGPDEPEDQEMATFYRALLRSIGACDGLRGEWRLWEVCGWPDNQSSRNLLAWSWNEGEKMTLIVVNYAGQPSQRIIEAGWPMSLGICRMEDPIAETQFERDGTDLQENGLYVEHEPWGRTSW